MKLAQWVHTAVVLYASLWGLYLLLLALAAKLLKEKSRSPESSSDHSPTLAVLVPAGNVGRAITRCVDALLASSYPRELIQIQVIADHCTDETAEHARAAGANVLVRNEGARGKTYAIAWALEQLKDRGIAPDLYVIVDATAIVQEGFLSAMAECWRRGDDIVSNYTMVSRENRSWYARCLALMFVHRNLQNQARQRLGLSAMLGGCGMAFSRNYIARFGWSLALPKVQGSHPTEDWRHAVRAVEEGFRVAFAQNARVATPLRASLTKATQQGARWERGRLINAGTYAVRLLLRGIWEREPVKVFAALDAMQPPVAILAALSFGLAAFTFVFGVEGTANAVLAYVSLTAVVLYASLVVVAGRREGIAVTTAIWGPVYLGWRCASFILAWVFVDRVNFARRASDCGQAAHADRAGS